MEGFTSGFLKTAAKIGKSVSSSVQSAVQDALGPKCMQDYEQLDQVGSGGPGLLWKLYRARSRSKAAGGQGQPRVAPSDVCIWFLDKRLLAEERAKKGTSKVLEDAVLDIFRTDAALLLKLRHPGIVRVIEPLDETKNAMAFVTEPVFASVANVLKCFDNIAKVPQELTDLDMSQLEIKHGLLQLAESVSFLHNNAKLVHRSINPESVFITASGAWKFGGFGFATMLDHSSEAPPSEPIFHYPDYDVAAPGLPLVPLLDYLAPELTRSNGGQVCTGTDLFSVACLVYRLLASDGGLLSCNNNLKKYNSLVSSLAGKDFLNMPVELVPELKRMLSSDALSRPSAVDFANSAFFREDQRLRALRFLDKMLERDALQKSEFLRALAGLWTGFDARVLRYKVLPPLCAELRSEAMQPLVLPMILSVAEGQGTRDFEGTTLPALLPVIQGAQGDSLLLLLKHTPMIISKVNDEVLKLAVVPMLVRSYEDGDVRIQEEVLRRTLAISEKLDFPVLKQGVLPRVHALAMKTAVAAVRVHALKCLADLVPRMDKPAVLEVLQTLARVSAVDHSPPTLMCVLACCEAMYKAYGFEFGVEKIVPLLAPLLVVKQLNAQQFTRFLRLVQDVLRSVEEKRAVSLDDAATIPAVEAKAGPAAAPAKAAAGAGSSWDVDDWGSIAKQAASAKSTASSGSSLFSPPKSASPAVAATTAAAAASPPSSFDWPPLSPTKAGVTGLPPSTTGLTPPKPAAPTTGTTSRPSDPMGGDWDFIGSTPSLAPSVGTSGLFSVGGGGSSGGAGMATSRPNLGLGSSSAEAGTPHMALGGGALGGGALGGGSLGGMPPPEDDDPFANWPPRGGATGAMSNASSSASLRAWDMGSALGGGSAGGRGSNSSLTNLGESQGGFGSQVMPDLDNFFGGGAPSAAKPVGGKGYQPPLSQPAASGSQGYQPPTLQPPPLQPPTSKLGGAMRPTSLGNGRLAPPQKQPTTQSNTPSLMDLL